MKLGQHTLDTDPQAGTSACREYIGDAVFVLLSTRPGRRAYKALVDRDDFDRVTSCRWAPVFTGSGVYARATSLRRLPAHHQMMHAFVLRRPPRQIVDHINGDTLDNRRQNLRIVSAQESAMNRRPPGLVTRSSHFKGVAWDWRATRWRASITVCGQRHELGLFENEATAAAAYDDAAVRLHGEFARTNAMLRLFDAQTPFVPDVSRGLRRSWHQKVEPVSEPRHDVNGCSAASKQLDRQRRDEEYLKRRLTELGAPPTEDTRAPRSPRARGPRRRKNVP